MFGAGEARPGTSSAAKASAIDSILLKEVLLCPVRFVSQCSIGQLFRHKIKTHLLLELIDIKWKSARLAAEL
jgi:hypothetical protein